MSPILTPLPLAANAVINIGDMVCFDGRAPDGSGLLYVVPASDTAGLSAVIGQAQGAADNTGGADGAQGVHVIPGQFEYPASGLVLGNQNQLMFVTGAQTFAPTSTNLIPCGRLVRYISATDGILDLSRRPTRRAWTFRQPSAAVSHSGWSQLSVQPYTNYQQNTIIRFMSVELAAAAGSSGMGFCVGASTCAAAILNVSSGQKSNSVNNLAAFIGAGSPWYVGINNSVAGSDPIIMVEGDCYDLVEAAQ